MQQHLHLSLVFLVLLLPACASSVRGPSPEPRDASALEHAVAPVAPVTALAQGPRARVGATATLDAQGETLLLWGGVDARSGEPAREAWLFSLTEGRWSSLGAQAPRSQHAAQWWGSRWWLLGGRDPLGAPLGVCSVSRDGVVHAHDDAGPAARWGGSAIATSTGLLYVGGVREDGGEPLSDTWWREGEAGPWRALTAAHAPAGRSEALSVWAGGRALLWGGAHPWAEPFELRGAGYAPGAVQWEPLGPGGPLPEAGVPAAYAQGYWALATAQGLWLWSEPGRRWYSPEGLGAVRSVLALRGRLWALVGAGEGSTLRALSLPEGVLTGEPIAAAALDRSDALVAGDGVRAVVLFGRRGAVWSDEVTLAQ